MSIIFLIVLLVALGIFIVGIVKKSKSLIFTAIVSGLMFAGLFYMLGQALSNM